MISERHELPLARRKILITRSAEGNVSERTKLESLGAQVVELPSIEIAPPSSWDAVDAAISHIEEFDWIVFTSANGVRSFFNRARPSRNLKSIGAHFACVGPATSIALKQEGVEPSFMPEEFLTESLGEELARKYPLRGKKILLSRAEIAGSKIVEILRKAGALVVEAPAYRTIPKKAEVERLLDGVTDITLTSPSTVDGLVLVVSAREIEERRIAVHCIGPVTAKHATELGLRVDSTARVHTIDGLVETLSSDHPHRMELR